MESLGLHWKLKLFVLALLSAQVPCSDDSGGHRCHEETDRWFYEILIHVSGAQVVARPGENFERSFKISEHMLLECKRNGHAPWRFGHNMLCVAAPACDSEELVRKVALPYYLSSVGANVPEEVVNEMVLQRIDHWNSMIVHFVVAGFESGGTTSLVTQLRKAPDIYMMPFELSGWGGGIHEPPICEAPLGPPSYWPAFMSYAFWPALDTVNRFNNQVERCASNKLVGVWDSRYIAHELAVRKIAALLSRSVGGRVIVSFRDPVKYVVSTFNRMPSNAPGGQSFAAVVTGSERASDPYQLQLWKGNFSILVKRLLATLGDCRLLLQPFDLLAANPAIAYGRIFQFLGSSMQVRQDDSFPHENARQAIARVDPCSKAHSKEIELLTKLYRSEYARLERVLVQLGSEVPIEIHRKRPEWHCFG